MNTGKLKELIVERFFAVDINTNYIDLNKIIRQIKVNLHKSTE